MTDLSGYTLGPYHIGGVIGQGGMATIYQAYDTRHGRPVALKVLLPHLQYQQEFVERFWREARHAATLQHPHIVPIHDSGRLEDGRPYIAMAWADGGSLADRLDQQRGPLPLEQTATILGQVAAALDYAHQRGVVHRDVKPSNILLSGDGRAMLTDFGIAKAAGDSRLTGTGVRLGTPAYMAPEQARGRAVGRWTDVYALGVVLYEMLTGQPPFQGDNTDAVLYQHVHEPPPPLRSRNPALPPALERVVGRALAKAPRQRYRTAGELAADCQAALPAASRRTPPRPSPQQARAQPWPIVVLLAALAVFAVVAAVILSSILPSSPGAPTGSPVAASTSPTPAATVAGSTTTPTESGEAPPTPAPPAGERLTLTDPREGQRFPAGSTVTLRWNWPALAPGQRFRVTMRDEDRNVTLPTQGRWTTEALEYTPPGTLRPGRYTWLVVVEKQVEGEWEEVARSERGTFTILPPPTATATPPLAPALVDTPALQRLAAPTLSEPEDKASFVGKEAGPTFRWSAASRPLGADEYYVLIIEHGAGKDFTWTKEPSYSVGDDKRWLADYGPELKWRVVIARQRTGEPNEDPTGAELSDYSESRVFYWSRGDDGGGEEQQPSPR